LVCIVLYLRLIPDFNVGDTDIVSGWNKYEAVKDALKQNPLTSDYAVLDEVPVNVKSGTVDVEWEGKDPNNQVVFPTLRVTEEFFDVFRMKMLSGRPFSKEFKSDTSNYILNEKAARVMGYTPEEAIGKPLTLYKEASDVILGSVS